LVNIVCKAILAQHSTPNSGSESKHSSSENVLSGGAQKAKAGLLERGAQL
jgi:hypothetical protein